MKRDTIPTNVFNQPGKTFMLPTQEEQTPGILSQKFPVSFKNSPFLIVKAVKKAVDAKKCKENVEMYNKIFDEHLDMLVNELELNGELEKATFVKNVRENYLSTVDKKVEKYITTELFGMKNIRGKKNDPLYKKMKKNDNQCKELMETIDQYSTTGISLAEYAKINVGKSFEPIGFDDIIYSEEEAKKRTRYNLNKIRDEIIPEMEDVLNRISSTMFGINKEEIKPPSPMVAYEIAGLHIASEFIHYYKFEPEKLKLQKIEQEDESHQIGLKFSDISNGVYAATNSVLGGIGFTLGLINKFFNLDCIQNYITDNLEYWMLFYIKFNEYVAKEDIDPGMRSFLEAVTERIIDQLRIDTGLTQKEIKQLKTQGTKLTQEQIKNIMLELSRTSEGMKMMEKLKDLLKNVGIFVLIGSILSGVGRDVFYGSGLSKIFSLDFFKYLFSSENTTTTEFNDIEALVKATCNEEILIEGNNIDPAKFIEIIDSKGFKQKVTNLGKIVDFQLSDPTTVVPENLQNYFKRIPKGVKFMAGSVPQTLQDLSKNLTNTLVEGLKNISTYNIRGNVANMTNFNENLKTLLSYYLVENIILRGENPNDRKINQALIIIEKIVNKFKDGGINVYEEVYKTYEEVLINFSKANIFDIKLENDNLFKYQENLAEEIKKTFLSTEKSPEMVNSFNVVMDKFLKTGQLLSAYKSNMPGIVQQYINNICIYTNGAIDIAKKIGKHHTQQVGSFQIVNDAYLDRGSLFYELLNWVRTDRSSDELTVWFDQMLKTKILHEEIFTSVKNLEEITKATNITDMKSWIESTTENMDTHFVSRILTFLYQWIHRQGSESIIATNHLFSQTIKNNVSAALLSYSAELSEKASKLILKNVGGATTTTTTTTTTATATTTTTTSSSNTSMKEEAEKEINLKNVIDELRKDSNSSKIPEGYDETDSGNAVDEKAKKEAIRKKIFIQQRAAIQLELLANNSTKAPNNIATKSFGIWENLKVGFRLVGSTLGQISGALIFYSKAQIIINAWYLLFDMMRWISTGWGIIFAVVLILLNQLLIIFQRGKRITSNMTESQRKAVENRDKVIDSIIESMNSYKFIISGVSFFSAILAGFGAAITIGITVTVFLGFWIFSLGTPRIAYQQFIECSMLWSFAYGAAKAGFGEVPFNEFVSDIKNTALLFNYINIMNSIFWIPVAITSVYTVFKGYVKAVKEGNYERSGTESLGMREYICKRMIDNPSKYKTPPGFGIDISFMGELTLRDIKKRRGKKRT